MSESFNFISSLPFSLIHSLHLPLLSVCRLYAGQKVVYYNMKNKCAWGWYDLFYPFALTVYGQISSTNKQPHTRMQRPEVCNRYRPSVAYKSYTRYCQRQANEYFTTTGEKKKKKSGNSSHTTASHKHNRKLFPRTVKHCVDQTSDSTVWSDKYIEQSDWVTL